MSHTFYNSLDSACKSPFGAIPAGQAVTFNLTVPENLGYVDPHLVLTKDHEDPVHYRMAVSYTHLDVYKRQLLHSTSATAAMPASHAARCAFFFVIIYRSR